MATNINFVATARYAHLLFDGTAPKRWYTLTSGDRVLLRFESRLGRNSACLLPLDLAPWKGEELFLSSDQDLDIEPLALSDALPDPPGPGVAPPRPLYQPLRLAQRPQRAVLSGRKLSSLLSAQPCGTDWWNMHWGHAVSRDLVCWQEWGDALAPDKTGTMFSGSAVVDEENRGGFGRGALLVYYTAAGDTSPETCGARFTQRMAISTDGGRTLAKRAEPVLPHINGDNRDPKLVFVDELDAHVIALYLDGETYGLYTSRDLVNFSPLQTLDLPGEAECPDLIPLSLDGDPSKRRWVFWSAKEFYWVGALTNGRFAPLQPPISGPDSEPSWYATQTFNHAPIAPGTALQIAWARVPTSGAGSTCR